MPRLLLAASLPILAVTAAGAAVIAVAALAAGCGGSQKPNLPAGQAYVAAVRVTGNSNIGSGELVDGLALERTRSQGQEFDPFLVGQDLERIRGYYLRRGFFRVQVTSKIERRGDGVTIVYTVNEGPRARLTRVEIAGLPDDPKIDREELRKVIPLEDGEPFVYEVYELARPKLISYLENVGYAYVRLESKVAADRLRDEAIIRLEFTPGPLCTFGAITLEGVTGELADAVRARVDVQPGERYSSGRLAEAQAEIFEMGRFGNVRVEPDRSSNATAVPVHINASLAPPHELRLGGGFGINPTAYEVRGRASYEIAGWPRPLVTTHLELRPAYVFLRDGDDGEPRIEAIGSLERLDFLRPRLRGSLELAFAYLAVEAYTSVGPRVRLGLRSPIYRRIIEAGAGWTMKVLDFRDIDPALTPEDVESYGLTTPYVLGYYDQVVSADFRDNPVEPHIGAYAEIRAEEGTIAAGGDFEYVRLTPEVRGYAPLPFHWVLASKARVGTIFGEIPVTQRYLAGGGSSQRGFPERRLAPTLSRTLEDGTTRSVVIGGGGLAETSLELRIPISNWWKLDWGMVVFLDGADVTERLDQIDLLNLHWATGAGLRIGTPIGPVRFDVGYRLNRKGPGEIRPDDEFAYHLSLGEAF